LMTPLVPPRLQPFPLYLFLSITQHSAQRKWAAIERPKSREETPKEGVHKEYSETLVQTRGRAMGCLH